MDIRPTLIPCLAASLLSACDGSLSVPDGDLLDAGLGASAPIDLAGGPVTVAWPRPPQIVREARVTGPEDATAAVQSGTRVVVAVSLDRLEVAASDVEVVVEPGVRIGVLRIAHRLSRVVVRGGRFGAIEVDIPGTFYPEERWDPSWRTTDLLVDGVEVDAADTAFLLRGGVRMAVIRSRAHAARYGVWLGDTADFESEDIVIAGNDLRVDGAEPTVRLVHVRRAAVVGNRLENPDKHNYRVHGRSSDHWAARNVLVGGGVMIGTLPTDLWAIERASFDDNTLHHDLPSLLELDPRSLALTLRRNHVYTDVWDCFLCVPAQPTWVVEDNVREPFRPAP